MTRAEQQWGSAMNDDQRVEDTIQSLKNQRFWPDPDTLDEDLQTAIDTLEWMRTELIQHIEMWIKILDHIEHQHGTDNE